MNRRAVVAAAAWVPPVAVELLELKRGVDGMPYTRYILRLPRWVIKALLITAFVVLWDHFIHHD